MKTAFLPSLQLLAPDIVHQQQETIQIFFLKADFLSLGNNYQPYGNTISNP